ncbi:MAG TPA: dephospho-CoA kinase [Dehalococcoidia bacterium]|jgi:dephospho-CoA kinase|nr:dephospho-CoA kinase [Dehalococcoidia bacterium]
MKVIGLTGGIGSGKSTVSRFLAELGAKVINADKIGHKLFQPDTEAWREVVVAFGRGILATDGSIDRKKLGAIVFADPEALAKLNRIMHPRIREAVQAQLERYRSQGVAVAVVEAPLLVEAEWTSLVDEVWVTTASEATILKRLKKRAGLSEPESRARIRSQLASEERIKQADVVIDTDCSLDELKAKVRELWQRLKPGI